MARIFIQRIQDDQIQLSIQNESHEFKTKINGADKFLIDLLSCVSVFDSKRKKEQLPGVHAVALSFQSEDFAGHPGAKFIVSLIENTNVSVILGLIKQNYQGEGLGMSDPEVVFTAVFGSPTELMQQLLWTTQSTDPEVKRLLTGLEEEVRVRHQVSENKEGEK